MAKGQRIIVCLLVVISVLLSLNLLVRGSPSAEAQAIGGPPVPVAISSEQAFAGGGWACWIFIIIVVAVVVVLEYFIRRCPKCGRSWSLRKTGAREKGDWLKSDRYALKCKHCDHTMWRRPPFLKGQKGGAQE